jgi:hemerythrin superfamily protein
MVRISSGRAAQRSRSRRVGDVDSYAISEQGRVTGSWAVLRHDSRVLLRAMDAITLLKQDHKTVNSLFRKFETAGERAMVTKRELAQKIVRELSVHAAIEEQVFYPAVRAEVSDANSKVLESLEEHHVVKWLCSEVESLGPEDERFDAKMTVLIEVVRHHVSEEESTLFPEVRQALGRKRLAEIGDALAKAKESAPTRPHPRLADTPPLNVAIGSVAAVVDRAYDAGKKVLTGKG